MNMDIPIQLASPCYEFVSVMSSRFSTTKDQEVNIVKSVRQQNNSLKFVLDDQQFHLELVLSQKPVSLPLIQPEEIGNVVAEYLGYHQCFDYRDVILPLICVSVDVRAQFDFLHPHVAIETLDVFKNRLFSSGVSQEKRVGLLPSIQVMSFLYQNEEIRTYVEVLFSLPRFAPCDHESIRHAFRWAFKSKNKSAVVEVLKHAISDGSRCLLDAIYKFLGEANSSKSLLLERKEWLSQLFQYPNLASELSRHITEQQFWLELLEWTFCQEFSFPKSEQILYHTVCDRMNLGGMSENDVEKFEMLMNPDVLVLTNYLKTHEPSRVKRQGFSPSSSILAPEDATMESMEHLIS